MFKLLFAWLNLYIVASVSILTIITSLFSKTNPKSSSLLLTLFSLMQDTSNKSNSITGTILFNLLKLLMLFVGKNCIKNAFSVLSYSLPPRLLNDFLLSILYMLLNPCTDFLASFLSLVCLFFNIIDWIYLLLNSSTPFFMEP